MAQFIIESPAKISGTVRGQIVQVLSKEHPLSLTDLHRKISKRFGSRVSFQAARKAANMLLDEGILLRNHSKEYEISKKWILDSKRFFDSLSDAYVSKAGKKVFGKLFSEGDYAEYKLTSLYELDNFWSDMLVHLADNIRDDELHEIVAYNNCAFWFLINYGSEVSLFEYYRKKGMRGFLVYPEDNFINSIAIRNYNSLGFPAKVVRRRPFPKSMDINVVGDTIIQVHFPDMIVKKLQRLVEKYDSAKDVPVRELNALVNTMCDIKFVCFKNPEMAKSLRSQLLRAFKGKGAS